MTKKKLIIYVGVAILLFIIGSLLIVPLEDAFNSVVSLGTFSIIISLALSVFVFSNTQLPTRRLFAKNKEKISVDRKKAFVLASIMFISALVFFFIGFYFRAWYVAWIAFVVGGITIDIIISKGYKK